MPMLSSISQSDIPRRLNCRAVSLLKGSRFRLLLAVHLQIEGQTPLRFQLPQLFGAVQRPTIQYRIAQTGVPPLLTSLIVSGLRTFLAISSG